MTETTCHSCGRAVDDSLRVCPGCGAKIKKVAASPDAPFKMAPDDDVPTIDLEESSAPETPSPEPEAPPMSLAEEGPKAPEADPALETAPLPDPESDPALETGALPDPEVEAPEADAPEVQVEGAEDEEVEPRGDTVQMSLSDATKAWVEDSDTKAEPAAPSADAPPSKLPLLIGILVLAAAVLAVALFVL